MRTRDLLRRGGELGLEGDEGDEGLGTLVERLDRWPGSLDPNSAGDAAIFGWGGEMNRVPPEATAFAHRHAQLILELDTSWGGSDPGWLVREHKQWLADGAAALRPYLSEASYQNFIDPQLKNWQRAHYGSNFGRLRRIKRADDPGNFFRFAQSIPPR